jgi:DNA repair protein RadC
MTKANIYQVKLVKVGEIDFVATLDGTYAGNLVQLLFEYLDGADRENMVVIMLNTKYKVIGVNTAHIGSLDSAVIHPREIFKPAILSNAAAIVIAHNHPSGDAIPSHQDVDVTEKIKDAGEMIGIELLDHIIIGNKDTMDFYSMRERGIVYF